jgi:DNA-binding transcriptional LysR family regulator
MDLIANVRSFLRVSETGSFSAVAAERGVTQPAISRQVSALEDYLGARLVQRSTQAVTLTEEGKGLIDAARELVDAADELFQSATRAAKSPEGLVRVALPVPLGLFLSDRIPALLHRYEKLSVEVVMRDRVGHLVEEGLDLEVRLGEIENPSLVCRRIGSTSTLIVAAPEYLERTRCPQHPRDLEHHDCIVNCSSGRENVWWFTETGRSEAECSVAVRGKFSADNATAIHRAALAGQGIASLSHLLVTDDIENGRLRQLVPQFAFRRAPVYITYPSRRRLPHRTRAVIDFIVTLLQQDPQMKV